MKKKIIILLLILFIPIATFSQDSIRLTNNFGSENNDIQNLIDFENIYIEQLHFESEKLKGMYYVIKMDEYKDGNFIQSSTLFDASESDYFKVSSKRESIKFFFKMSDGKLKIYIRGDKYGSKKSYFKLNGNPDKYALKDFFGSKKELQLPSKKVNAVFAIITPTIHKDGSGSYCEVAQSDIEPSKLGKVFKIPHYFIVTIQFKN